MFHHLQLRVQDVPASARFYRAALGALGIPPADADGTSFGGNGVPGLYLTQGSGGGVHVAFAAKDPAAVERFHRDALAAGGRDHGAPGPRPDYGPTYWAAFVLDPDGNNVEAVCDAAG